MARRDLGWNRDDIDFDGNGRLVIKNPALVREIQTALKGAGGEIEAITVKSPPRPGPPQPNMCGCTIKLMKPEKVSEVPAGARKKIPGPEVRR